MELLVPKDMFQTEQIKGVALCQGNTATLGSSTQILGKTLGGILKITHPLSTFDYKNRNWDFPPSLCHQRQPSWLMDTGAMCSQIQYPVSQGASLEVY